MIPSCLLANSWSNRSSGDLWRDGVGNLKAIARVRGHGLSANATITKVVEQDIQIPKITTTMAHDSHGVLHRHIGPSGPRGTATAARAGGKKEGQTIQIVYDPAKPTSITPGERTPVGLTASSRAWGRSPFWGIPSTSGTAPGARVRSTLMTIES